MKLPTQDASKCTMQEADPVSALLSWQAFTQTHDLILAFRLDCWEMPREALADVGSMNARTKLTAQAGPYHDGRWKILPLVSPDGDPERQFGKSGDTYRPTTHLRRGTALHKYLHSLPGELRRVRLSRLEAGGAIDWHFDDFEEKTGEEVFRLHTAIKTSSKNFQILSHSAWYWDVGQMWLGDYRFPHKVINASCLDRLHLIIDIVPSTQMVEIVNQAAACEWFGISRLSLARNAQALLRDFRTHKKDSTL